MENWFSKIQRQLINRTSFTSKSTLCQTIERYINCYNQHWLKPLKWKFKGFIKILILYQLNAYCTSLRLF
nr:hypothetical protein [uncultured Microscilla sp.]